MKRADVKFVDAWAVFSGDRLWRYSLGRVWDVKKPLLGWVALNPSNADVEDLDPTTRRSPPTRRGSGKTAMTRSAPRTTRGCASSCRELMSLASSSTWGANAKRDRVYDVTKLLVREAQTAKRRGWEDCAP